MFKNLLVASVLALTSVSALAGNSQYGVVSEIHYNTPTTEFGASILVVLKADQTGFSNSSEFMGCYPDGVQNWYVNLEGNSIVVNHLIERIKKAEMDETVVRFFGDDAACNSGDNQFNDTIQEAYFYKSEK